MSEKASWLNVVYPSKDESETVIQAITGSEHKRQSDKINRCLEEGDIPSAQSAVGSMRAAQPTVSMRIDAGRNGGYAKDGYRTPFVQLVRQIVAKNPNVDFIGLKAALEEEAPNVELGDAPPAGCQIWNVEIDDEAEKVYWREPSSGIDSEDMKLSSLRVLLSKVKSGY